MTDYKALARTVAAGRAAAVEALQETRTHARARSIELMTARHEGRAATALQTQERHLLDTRIPGFFPTPPQLAARMIAELAPTPGARILEPSAGNGHIAQAIKDASCIPHCIEKMYSLAEICASKGFDCECRDFLEWIPDAPFAYIAMNPPFERGADIEHVRHAFTDCLLDGGRMIAIMGAGAFFRSDKKAVEFRAWLDRIGNTTEELPAGTFKQAGTNVTSRLVTLWK